MRSMILAATGAMLVAGSALAAPVDLTSWSAEGGGTWVVQPGNTSVLQTVNGNPTVFYGPGNAQGRKLSGTIRVGTTGDDDFIGFVLGFQPGDLAAGPTDFILVDWKQLDQGGFFGCVARDGLAISRVTTGLPTTNRGAWCHDADGVTELQRAANLGSTGWLDNTTYTFDLEFTATNIKVFVNGVEELDLDGSFENGRFGFYNYSQASVLYAGIEEDPLPDPDPDPVPAPAALALFGLGAASLGLRALRRR